MSDFKTICLTKGYEAIVDAEDYEWLSQYSWHVSFGSTGLPYACTSIKENGEFKVKRMHRLIMDAPDDKDVDHIHGDTLDNRRSELRICKHKQNCSNRRQSTKKLSSVYKGVSWYSCSQKWVAKIKHNYKQFHLGLFYSEIDAARAYNGAAKRYFGDYALLNEIVI